jgi:AcrR family transcriptional regulator
MNTQVRIRPDDTRARIVETAFSLFRRLGFAKTAVADIASELGMSPANVYRFFPSKTAIVQAICQRCLGELDEKIWAVARGRGSSTEKLQRLVLAAIAHQKENLLQEQKLNDIVLVAIEENWDAIQAHKEVYRTAIELILRDGIEAGEFEPVDPRETAVFVFRALVAYCHPILIAEAVRDGRDLEAEAPALVRFLVRALTPRK